MRDIWLLAWLSVGLGLTFRYPFVGVLLWEWLSVMNPHQEAYGFIRSIPLNLIIAVVTLLSWLMSKEPKHIPKHSIITLLALFLVWTTFNSFFAFDPSWSWTYWDRTWRIFFFGFIVAAMATDRVRIEAIIWVAIISLLHFGVKGGIFTVVTGGAFHVLGPADTIIADNNQLALALLMTMPLVEYMRTSVSYKPLSWLLGISMVLTTISIIGSYSRGAYIAMAAMAVFALLKARRKLVFLAVLAIAATAIYYFTPQGIIDRASTIQSADSDASFHGRWVAWQVAILYATDHFPFGAGFYGPQLHAIFYHYFPDEAAHAAHSIYFQVLGEHGFAGLGIYLALAFVSFVWCWRLARTPQQEATQWVQKLAGMIQISLFAFLIGGAALSMAYYDLFIILICLIPQLARLSQKASTKQPAFRAPDQFISKAG